MDGAPSFKDLYKSLITEMSKDAKGFYPLEKLASIIHRPSGELILLGMMLVITLTVFDIGCTLILVLLGCSYPGYMSLKVTAIPLRPLKVQTLMTAVAGSHTG